MCCKISKIRQLQTLVSVYMEIQSKHLIKQDCSELLLCETST